MIYLKEPDEIGKIRAASRIVVEALDLAATLVAPGVSTKTIDSAVEELIRSRGAVPSFLGYHDYPASTCLSINDEVVHGIPGDRVLREGDIISVDVGAYHNGYHGDSARTFAVGQVPETALRLMKATQEALAAGIAAARAGSRLGAISNAVQTAAERQGFSVVRDLVGHGIGRKLHEDPQVPNYGPRESGPVLRAGMVLAIEPMINEGGWEVRTLPDKWTVVTRDGKLSAHFEHTIAVTEGDAEILTRA